MERFEEHVRELKKRLRNIFVAFSVTTALSFYFSSQMLQWLQADLAVDLKAHRAYEVFYTEIMIAIIVGFFLALPYTLYQLIRFMKPGLRDHEYRILRNYLPFSVLLFAIGAVFSYQYIVKTSFGFFQSVGRNANVEAVWGLKNTLGFALKLSGFTGIIFQLPIVSVVLAKAGILDSEMMRSYRNYFFVAILVAAAIATPPDVITQLLITVPVLGLYQASIWLVARIE